jgi:hypothetical protein
MSPDQALQIVDNVGSKYVGTREDHVQIQSAVLVLKDLVNKAEAESSKGKAEASTPENAGPASDGKDSSTDKVEGKIR